jgi:hypothetical protein
MFWHVLYMKDCIAWNLAQQRIEQVATGQEPSVAHEREQPELDREFHLGNCRAA